MNARHMRQWRSPVIHKYHLKSTGCNKRSACDHAARLDTRRRTAVSWLLSGISVPSGQHLSIMSTMQRYWRGVFITLLFTAVVAPVHAAEPLTLFLLNLLRDQIVSSSPESPAEGIPPPRPAALQGVYGISEAQLRALIDTGFVHLTSSQRAEIYASLTQMLADPKNALARPLIIRELAEKASAVRGVHERLSALTPAEKRVIAADARAEYERLAPDERVHLLRFLQSKTTPIPRDLNDLVLAEFTAARKVAEAATGSVSQ